MTVEIHVWEPVTPEAVEVFFQKTVPAMRALKQRHLKDLFAGKEIADDYVGVRLAYLERRLRALQPGDAVYFAKIKDRIAGFLLVRWDENEKRTKLEQFYVDPTIRSQGIGTDLLKKSFEHARKTHVGESQGIFLSTDKNREDHVNRARQLYEKMGFHVSEKPGDVSYEDRFDLDF